jgi:epoxyqueuosine reductase QueG
LVPEEFRPTAIWPEARTVIVIGLPVSLPIIETAPSIWYHELYRTINTLLDTSGYRIAASLTGLGFPSVWVPRDGYGSIGILKERPVAFFSHKHAAYLAGLGTFGVNNTLLTREYGPRIRFASIFTSAEIPADPVIAEDLCLHCMQCVKICPVKAISGKSYPEGIIDKSACAARSEELAGKHQSPCGFCIKVCPVGEDRKIFSRKNPTLYDEKNTEFEKIHNAWSHVRSYGSR